MLQDVQFDTKEICMQLCTNDGKSRIAHTPVHGTWCAGLTDPTMRRHGLRSVQ